MNDPFAERVERLKQELELALKWDRPSILLAVYGSEFVRTDAEGLLEAWLREQGLSVARIRITDPDDAVADLPQTLHEWPHQDETVFFVVGLAQGAPTTWKALNVRREYLVEDKVRAVFWLTEREAAELPRRAPDFWAFRHWVVEFLEAPRVEQAAQRAGELAWRGFEERLPPEERKARIDLRERLLAELPETEETAAARAELHYTLGGLCHWDRKYEKALAHFRVAHDLAERLGNTQLRAWSLNGLGNVYDNLGRYEEAIGSFERAIDLDPEDAHPHNGLGNVYYQQGRYEEAIAAYQRAIELDPEIAYPHNGLGNVYYQQGRYEEAIAAYQRAIELDPEVAYPHNNLGSVYADLGRYEEAIAAYQRAIDLDPEDASPHNGLGNVYDQQGRYEEAIAAYQRAIDLDPEVAYPHNNLGNVYRAQSRHEEAIKAYKQALSVPDSFGTPASAHTLAHNGLGNVYRAQGRYEEAIAAYQRAIDLDPEFAYPHNGLGNVYRAQGRHEEAIAAYQRAIDLDPEDAYPHNGLGNVYRAQGRYEEAIAAYQRAIDLDPEYATPRVGLAGVYRHIGDTDASRHHAEQARQLLAPDDHYNKACIESIAGNADAALDHLAKALERVPGMQNWARRDPDLAFIRDDPRFQALMKEEK
jgi:tetratricopeptide (TPR) repeat protein